MATLERDVGPNTPCPCGSGKKYKRCCGTLEAIEARNRQKRTRFLAKWGIGVVAVLLLVTAGAVLASLREPATVPPPETPANSASSESAADDAATPQAASAPAQPAQDGAQAAPPGPAPAGKVWSEEHGHWHNTPGFPGAGMPPGPNPGAGSNGGAAEAPGAAPPGKVWSAEHGHWHDAP